jgi:hypothetical protein
MAERRLLQATVDSTAGTSRAGIAAVLATLAASVALVAIWLAAPPMGTDLSAQVARADFFAGHGFAPIDFRWYGGVSPHGYSVVTPPLMAWFGVGPVGAAAAVVSSVALVLLFLRTGAARPLLGGVLGAACFAGNLVSGRVTFAVGVALGLLALLVLASPSLASIVDPRRRVAGLLCAGLLAALAAAASPVAGLFTGLAGVALLAGAHDPRTFGERAKSGAPERALSPKLRERWGGLVLIAGAAVPMAVMAGLFGSGGWMNISRSDMVHAAVASLAVAVLVPHRVVRIGAVLSAAGVLAAYLVHTPVGLNSTRLATMFALPVVAAYATMPRRLRLHTAVWLVPVLVALAWWQPPVQDRDLETIDDPAASPGFFAPLQAELASRQPRGRVEVVPTVNYWESAYLDAAPLARGWLRQVDLERNPLFFDGTISAASYREWLTGNGVSYVALPRSELSWVGRSEAALVQQGLPYLTEVWANEDWTLYEVTGGPAIVEPPAALVDASARAVVFEATGPGEVLVRVRWSRWLAVSGPGEACLASAGDWTTVRVSEPGRYEVAGSLTAAGPRC